jgi:AraC family transcriptional regulator
MRPGTRLDTTQRILRVLVHVQQNLARELGLEELARVACFSPFHFHRVFRGMVGESVGQYVRRLRLEQAAQRLKQGKRTVTDIAFDAGYETHESFTRAFRGAFGCSPSEYRAHTGASTRIDSPAHVHLAEEGDEPAFEPLTLEASRMKVEIKTIAPMRVAFLRHVGPYEAVGETWERLCEHAGVAGLIGGDTCFLGASYDDPEVTPPDKIRYDACLTVADDFQGEGEVGAQTLGGGRYASVLHEGAYEKLNETYAALFGQWFPENGHEPGPAPCLEFYLNDPESTPPEELLTEICVRIA